MLRCYRLRPLRKHCRRYRSWNDRSACRGRCPSTRSAPHRRDRAHPGAAHGTRCACGAVVRSIAAPGSAAERAVRLRVDAPTAAVDLTHRADDGARTVVADLTGSARRAARSAIRRVVARVGTRACASVAAAGRQIHRTRQFAHTIATDLTCRARGSARAAVRAVRAGDHTRAVTDRLRGRARELARPGDAHFTRAAGGAARATVGAVGLRIDASCAAHGLARGTHRRRVDDDIGARPSQRRARRRSLHRRRPSVRPSGHTRIARSSP